MKKTLLYLVALLAALALLAACGRGNDAPESERGEPVGTAATSDPTPEPTPPPHEHIWAAATCAEPQTCTECGETYGEPLAHELTDANFHAAAVCLLCGDTVGEPLVPGLEAYGFTISERYVWHPYVTITGELALPTVGRAMVTDFRIDQDCEDLPEGYEWRILRVHLEFYDENASRYSWSTLWIMRCRYLFSLDVVSPGEGLATAGEFAISFRGEERAGLFTREVLINQGDWFWCDDWDGWLNALHTLIQDVKVQVPIGYEGAFFAHMNRGNFIEGQPQSHSEWFDGDSLFFAFN